ncbi:MAG: hypothetical protein NTY53_18325, partial [Kiritimatiellaeota bacterium]|nr:hypothetical protein [Kiritimatiellota bacterium]
MKNNAGRDWVASLCVALLWLPLAVAAAPKPNIVFCFADDWGRYANCYAALDARPTINSLLTTPNLDRVAGEGV